MFWSRKLRGVFGEIMINVMLVNVVCNFNDEVDDEEVNCLEK